ncbi:MAG: hypothetical protein HOM34_03425 [Planctomycetes bacterium]|jgi:hypothetical protein|nr:hypothetical protein [Planctomycetota bacterium]MBT4029856.1 hypothetical protein [Planctomycetota bacterium]MBT4559956.1 hypothetical protein [Planctomycetota bacterium]MBT5100294.1 hypothetical protein [Planctomycetota bacterium]MBT5119757.1 hypothetical protein [Planctomycetota bacterium]
MRFFLMLSLSFAFIGCSSNSVGGDLSQSGGLGVGYSIAGGDSGIMDTINLSFVSGRNDSDLMVVQRARLPWTAIYVPLIITTDIIFDANESDTSSRYGEPADDRNKWYYGDHDYTEDDKYFSYDYGFVKQVHPYLFPYVLTGPVLEYTYGSGWVDDHYSTHHHFERWNWNIGGGLIVKLPNKDESSTWHIDVGWDSFPGAFHFGFVWSH